MERLTSDRAVPDALRGGVIALGNFDGFHRGHQAVVARARAIADADGRPLIVGTFDPHPVRYFRPDAPPFRLTTLDQREALFAAAGADAMLVFQFDAALAALTAEAFIAEKLVAALGIVGAVTGEDFTFGHARGGNIAVLRAAGARLGFAVEAVGPVAYGGAAVSSSRIREALQTGDCEGAAALLTRPFAIEGVVQHGDKLGRELGYPTANLEMGRYLRPAYGVYAVRGQLPGGRVVDGVANLGIRPQIEPPKELLEPYFFDYSGDLYGQCIAVELIHYLRAEARFAGLDALKAQIGADCDAARRVLADQ